MSREGAGVSEASGQVVYSWRKEQKREEGGKLESRRNGGSREE